MNDAIPSIPSGKRPHRGTVILVFGILGLVICFPFGIAAWVMGSGDLAAMDRGEIDPDGRSMTQAGKICGIISVVMACLGIAAFVVFGAFAMIMGSVN